MTIPRPIFLCFFLGSGTDSTPLLIYCIINVVDEGGEGAVFKKALCCIVSKQIVMKFDTIVLQVNTHQLTESDF